MGEVKKPLNLLLPFHPLTNIEISEYYKNEPRFNGVCSRNNLPNKIKKGAYVINLDEDENTGTHWVSLEIKEINKFICNDTTKSSSLERIKSKIFRIQAYDSIMCGCFCIEFLYRIICLKVRHYKIILIYFLLMTLKRTIELLKEYLKNE